MKKHTLIILILLSLFTACGEPPGVIDKTETEYGYISARAIWPYSGGQKKTALNRNSVLSAPMPSTITIVTLSCSGGDMSPMSKDFDANLGQGTISGVPVGIRTLTIDGRDSNGTVLYSGSSDVTVKANINNKTTVIMKEVGTS